MSSPQDETAVVEVSGAIVKADEQWAGLNRWGPGAYTSLDLRKLEDRKLFVAAQQGEPDGLDAYINTEIALRHIVFHPVKSEDATTGEVNFWTRAVLILSNGKQISCGSQGILKSLQLAILLFGLPPWPGLRGKVTQRQLSTDRRWYQIEWDLEQTPCQPIQPDKPAATIPTAKRVGSQPSK